MVIFSAVLLSVVAWASEPREALKLLEKAQSALRAPTGHCYVCDLASPPGLTEGLDPFCEDLFGSICLNKQEEPKFVSDNGKLRESSMAMVELARDTAAKALGFPDFNEMLKGRLKSVGLETVASPPREEWNTLKKYSTERFFGAQQAMRVFPALAECEKTETTLGVRSFYSSDIGQIKAMVEKNEPEARKIRQRKVEFYSRDLPGFVSDIVSRTCERIESDSSLNEALNKAAFEMCRKKVAIRRRAVELFRKEKSESYLAEAKEFVEKFYVPDLTYGSPHEDPAVESWNVRLRAVKEAFDCYSYGGLAANIAEKTFAEASLELNRQKVMIDSLVDSFFPAETEKKLKALLDGARSDAKEVASRFVPKGKLASIAATFDELELGWKRKLPESIFMAEKDGIRVIDEAKLTPAIYDPLGLELITFLNDPSLSYFFSQNAAYFPRQAMGASVQGPKVQVLPPYILRYKERPYDLVGTISHEVGHHLGLEISRLNGYDLAPEYKDLLACLSSPQSISLRKGQEDEAIADFISAEIMAIQLGKIGAENRRPALAALLGSYCEDSDSLGIMCHGSHPENSLRVAGIYGANPSLRKAVGCGEPSSKYKSCGIGRAAR